MKSPGNVIINSPFVESIQHWVPQVNSKLALIADRRPACYEISDMSSNTCGVSMLELT